MRPSNWLSLLLISFTLNCGSSKTTTSSSTGGGSGPTSASWLVGENGLMLSVSDQGAVLSHTAVTAANLNGLTCVGPSTAWAVGDNGVVLYTTNGGQSWVSQISNTTSALRSLSFDSLSHGVAGGDAGVMLITNDGGATWAAATLSAAGSITAIKLNDGHGVAVTESGEILQSSDDGQTWTLLAQVDGALYGIDVGADGQKAIAVGDHVYAVTSNGATPFSFTTTGPLFAVHFLGDNVTAIAAGAAGSAITISDSGTMQPLTTGTTSDLHTLMVEDDSITLAGDTGTIIYFASATATAQALQSPSSANIRSIDDLGHD